MGKLRRRTRRATSGVADIVSPPARWVVLLTTSVRGDDERRELYTRQIRRWLDETDLFIFVIESSNHAFPGMRHDRLRVVAFDLSESLPSTSQYEAWSISHFLSVIRNDPVFQGATHILKVTGRYFLDGISSRLRSATEGTDFYLQERYNDSIRWQNSEYFGVRKDLLGAMVSPIMGLGFMEECLYEASRRSGRFRFLEPFPNRVARGGDGMVLDPL